MKQPTRSRIVLGSVLLSLVTCLAALTVMPEGVDAQRRLRATLYLTQQSIPRDVNEAGLLRWVRGHSSKILNETTAEEIPNRHWPGNLIIAFNAPPGDLEFHAIFYDVEDGPRNMVDDLSIFVGDPDQETYVQRINLTRPRFRPNRRMEMVVTVSHAEVGTLRFEMRGEEPRRDGMVDFGDGSGDDEE